MAGGVRGSVGQLMASIVSTPEVLAASPPPRGTVSVAGDGERVLDELSAGETVLATPINVRGSSTVFTNSVCQALIAPWALMAPTCQPQP